MPTLGGQTRTPEVARTLSIEWSDENLPSLGNAGYGSGSAPVTSLGRELGDDQRPTFVFLWNPETSFDEDGKVEKQLFGKDELALLSHYFRCVRVPSNELTEDEQKAYLRNEMGFLVFDAEGGLVAKAPGPQSAAKLTRLLGKTWATVYGENPAKRLKALDNALDELSKAEDAVANLGRTLKDAEERAEKSDRRKNIEKLEETKAKVAEAEGALAKAKASIEELLTVTVATSTKAN